jgi:TM2 domain-containing membrane protein YozV
VLVDVATNRQSAARDVPGLQHHFQLAPRSTYTPYQQQSWSSPPQPLSSYQPAVRPYDGPRKSKLTAALLAFFLGFLGVHRFYLGYSLLGFVMLCVCLIGSYLACCLGAVVTAVWAMVDFVLILINQLPDAEGRALD